LCSQAHGFNLHAATRVAATTRRVARPCAKYILRPPLANDRLKILDDGDVRLEFKRPWSDDYASHCTSLSLVDAIRCSSARMRDNGRLPAARQQQGHRVLMVVVVGVGLHEAVLAPAQDGLAADAVVWDNSRQSPSRAPSVDRSGSSIDTSRGCSRRSCCGSDGPGRSGSRARSGWWRSRLPCAVRAGCRLARPSPWASANSSTLATGVAAKHSVSRRREIAHARRWPLGL